MVRWLGGILLVSLLLGSLAVPVRAIDDPEAKVAKVIRNYIVAQHPNWSGDEIKIEFKFAEQAFNKIRSLAENTPIKIVEVYSEFKPVGNVVFPLSVGEEKMFLRAKVEVIKELVAAGRAIKKGKVLEAADLVTDKRDVAMLPEKYFVENTSLIGKETKISIPANSTLFEWMVGDQPLIRTGSEVNILATAPGLTVRTRGQLQEDGYLGAEVRVKRKDSKKIVVGKVISASEVEVKVE